MSVLLDTNLLLRLAQVTSPQHADAKSAILALDDAELDLCLVPQVIYEFWVVATRPMEANGLGMDVKIAAVSIQEMLSDYRLLKDEPEIFDDWLSLVTNYEVKGKTAHDPSVP